MTYEKPIAVFVTMSILSGGIASIGIFREGRTLLAVAIALSFGALGIAFVILFSIIRELSGSLRDTMASANAALGVADLLRLQVDRALRMAERTLFRPAKKPVEDNVVNLDERRKDR